MTFMFDWTKHSETDEYYNNPHVTRKRPKFLTKSKNLELDWDPDTCRPVGYEQSDPWYFMETGKRRDDLLLLLYNELDEPRKYYKWKPAEMFGQVIIKDVYVPAYAVAFERLRDVLGYTKEQLSARFEEQFGLREISFARVPPGYDSLFARQPNQVEKFEDLVDFEDDE
jgi:hypothetical protein